MATTYKIEYAVNIDGKECRKDATFIASADNVPDAIERFKTQLPAEQKETFALIECRVKYTDGLHILVDDTLKDAEANAYLEARAKADADAYSMPTPQDVVNVVQSAVDAADSTVNAAQFAADVLQYAAKYAADASQSADAAKYAAQDAADAAQDAADVAADAAVQDAADKPRLPDVWQIINVPKTAWKADSTGISCLISWSMPIDIVRMDLISADGVPIISFQGETDNVRKHSMTWLTLYVPAFGLDHAAYIGAELERADTERIDYIQDAKTARRETQDAKTLDHATILEVYDVKRYQEFYSVVPALTTFDDSVYYLCEEARQTFLVEYAIDKNIIIALIKDVDKFKASIDTK